MGRKTTINVKGSPEGVINAERINNITTACFLNLLKKLRFKRPIFDNIQDKSGNSKTNPIIKQSIKKLSMYESNETLLSIKVLS